MPVCFTLLHLSTDNKYAKIEGWLNLYHLAATHSVKLRLFEKMLLPGRVYLLNDAYLIRTYETVNGEALKVWVS